MTGGDPSYAPKPMPQYPNNLTGVIRCMKKDIREDIGHLIKSLKVKEIKITKINTKEALMYIWINKPVRYGTMNLLKWFRRFPFRFKYTHKSGTGHPFYNLHTSIEINAKTSPKGISLLN